MKTINRLTIITSLLAIAISLFVLCSCKKEKITPNQQQPPVIINNIQDSRLLGIWVCDSMKVDGGSIFVTDAVSQDTLTVTANFYSNIFWSGHLSSGYGYSWNTKGDSIITQPNYKYSIAQNKLWTYGSCKPNGIQYWYHKK